jgi:hypothetical protein
LVLGAGGAVLLGEGVDAAGWLWLLCLGRVKERRAGKKKGTERVRRRALSATPPLSFSGEKGADYEA